MLIPFTDDFEPRHIFECGQCFRFTRLGDSTYRIIAHNRVLTVSKVSGGLTLDSDETALWHRYFDMGYDYASARELISVGDFMTEAAAFGRGLRILRQDPWEALISFIISQNNNIPRIKLCIERLCTNFGLPIGGDAYGFPDAESLLKADTTFLKSLGLGYRGPYILSAAKAWLDGALDGLDALTYEQALKKLTTLNGVGPKVAACVLLYGYHRVEAFPVDVWMHRALERYFPPDFNPALAFSANAGLAQQYIFYYARSGSLF